MRTTVRAWNTDFSMGACSSDNAKFYAAIFVDGFQVRRIFPRRSEKKKNLWDISDVNQVEGKKNDVTASVVQLRKIMNGFKICFCMEENTLDLIYA